MRYLLWYNPLMKLLVMAMLLIASLMSFACQTDPTSGGIESLNSDRHFLEIEGTIVAEIFEATGGAQIDASHFEPITLNLGTGVSQTILDSLSHLSENTHQSGRVIGCDFEMRAMAELDFFEALITEISFPAMDNSSKNSGDSGNSDNSGTGGSTTGPDKKLGGLKITLNPKKTAIKQLTPDAQLTRNIKAVGDISKPLPNSYFRLSIEGIKEATALVEKMDPLTIKIDPNTKTLKLSNLVFALPETNAQEFSQWSAISRRGQIEYLDSNGDTIYSVTIENIGIFNLTTDGVEDHSDGIRRVKVECYIEGLKIDFPGA